jgi:hypothetical protein
MGEVGGREPTDPLNADLWGPHPRSAMRMLPDSKRAYQGKAKSPMPVA